MIRINKNTELRESELKFDFVRASGPGGQNVNKVATAAQLRFYVDGSQALQPAEKEKAKHIAGKKMNSEGVLVIEAKRYRTQEKNRQDAIDRLIKLLQKACAKEIKRIKTKPTASSNLKRIDAKKRTGLKKKSRAYREEI